MDIWGCCTGRAEARTRGLGEVHECQARSQEKPEGPSGEVGNDWLDRRVGEPYLDAGGRLGREGSQGGRTARPGSGRVGGPTARAGTNSRNSSLGWLDGSRGRPALGSQGVCLVGVDDGCTWSVRELRDPDTPPRGNVSQWQSPSCFFCKFLASWPPGAASARD